MRHDQLSTVSSAARLTTLVAFVVFLISPQCNTAASETQSEKANVVDVAPGDESRPAPAECAPLVSEVRVIGNDAISAGWIVASIKTTAGKPFDAKTMGADTKNLMRTGRFKAVKMRRENQPDGKLLVMIEVDEGTPLRYIKIEGTTKSDKLLVKHSGLKVGEPFDATITEQARRAVEEYLHGRGYPHAKVSILEGDKPEDHGVRLHVDEGERSKSFGFVASLPGGEQQPITMSFHGGVDQTRLDKITRHVTDHYRGLGYFRVRVGSEEAFDDDHNVASVKLVVNLGPRFVVKKVSFAGNRLLADNQLDVALHLKAGEFFDQSWQTADVARLRAAYADESYHFSEIKPRLLFSDEPGELELVYEITEGNQYRIGRVDCDLKGEDQDQRQKLLLQDFPLPAQAIAESKAFRKWTRTVDATTFQVVQDADGACKAIVQKFGPNDPTPLPERLHAGESIEIELLPVPAPLVGLDAQN
ncbi:MAG TPA: POTRA domain-containing protein [Pirellulales bacterium]|jgi:outer membrane protein insertion porin family